MYVSFATKKETEYKSFTTVQFLKKQKLKAVFFCLKLVLKCHCYKYNCGSVVCTPKYTSYTEYNK